jgi:ATP-dependent DNA helicase DinG
MAAFDRVLERNGTLRSRPGQRQMAEQVAQTFANGTLGQVEEGEEPERAIAVIEAGTGVGKSLAYAAPAIALALERKTRVMISTATVALQEQLVNKDLPALAATMDMPFRFALAKGRGRYVCKLKLARQAGDEGGGEDDLFADEPASDDGSGLPPGSEAERQARLQYYGALAKSLGRDWDGDRDNLPQAPAPEAWWPIAAEASSCTGKHCPVFSGCTYFEKRRELVGAQVIVVNHDLLLASLGGRNLPSLDNSLLVLDEAHHLPSVALDRFACSMDLEATTWIETLGSRCKRIGSLMLVSEAADAPRLAAQLQQSLRDLQRLVLDVYASDFAEAREGPDGTRVRVPDGRLPEMLLEPLGMVSAMADSFLATLSSVAKALRAQIRDVPDEARRLSVLYAQLGMLTPRLEQVHATTQLLLQETAPSSAPVAKWFSLHGGVRGPRVRAHASHVLPGGSLRAQLWSAVRSAVMSSATLRAGDAFDFFLREAGLAGDEAVTTLAVASPFDYPQQGRFVVVETRADPKDAARFTPEMVSLLLADLAEVRRGALVLFTSRDQMRQAVSALTPALRALVLVQGELPRTVLLERHRAAVAAGAPSIVFGMQSFGEGMDLPGAQCEQLFITKLPFASPDDPVGETRAAWLRSNGRDAFVELVLPATAMRLAQWAGRAIRTEDDQCSIHCYDRRLVATAFGRRLLAALPPFARWRRDANGHLTALE